MEKRELTKTPSVSIWLDRYEDVFSDFDSRPFNERALSDDFIAEAKKIAKEKPGGKIELKLLLPASGRNHETEEVIVRNLHTHFRHFAHVMEGEIKYKRRKGLLLSASGFLVMALAVYIISISGNRLYLNLLRVVFEPSGWFLVWVGFEDIFRESRVRKTELDFNSKMAHAEISFVSLP